MSDDTDKEILREAGDRLLLESKWRLIWRDGDIDYDGLLAKGYSKELVERLREMELADKEKLGQAFEVIRVWFNEQTCEKKKELLSILRQGEV